MNNRYIIHKLGFVNFWYYDFEEFLLSDGKLLLRGSNGSGKSVTMQSFIPLLLDGNKSPYRLDPFGTNARTISGYLLDDENTERTGYLYMEFKRRDSEHFITLCLLQVKEMLSYGEKYTDFYHRIYSFYHNVLKDLQGNILIVSHKGVLQLLISLLLNEDDSLFWNFDFIPGKYSILEKELDHCTVKNLNI